MPATVPRYSIDDLEPVFPAGQPLRGKWSAIRNWWLAVGVFSESSVIYDRDFKRNAYLAMGVAEVWLVDWQAEIVYVSRRGEPVDVTAPQSAMDTGLGQVGVDDLLALAKVSPEFARRSVAQLDFPTPGWRSDATKAAQSALKWRDFLNLVDDANG